MRSSWVKRLQVVVGVVPLAACGGPTHPTRGPGEAGVRLFNWDSCAFPAKADEDGVDAAVVVVQVKTDPSGRATAVTVLRDPGHGFADAARGCAVRASYEPALNSGGLAVEGETKPFRIRFERPPPKATAR